MPPNSVAPRSHLRWLLVDVGGEQRLGADQRLPRATTTATATAAAAARVLPLQLPARDTLALHIRPANEDLAGCGCRPQPQIRPPRSPGDPDAILQRRLTPLSTNVNHIDNFNDFNDYNTDYVNHGNFNGCGPQMLFKRVNCITSSTTTHKP